MKEVFESNSRTVSWLCLSNIKDSQEINSKVFLFLTQPVTEILIQGGSEAGLGTVQLSL